MFRSVTLIFRQGQKLLLKAFFAFDEMREYNSLCEKAFIKLGGIHFFLEDGGYRPVFDFYLAETGIFFKIIFERLVVFRAQLKKAMAGQHTVDSAGIQFFSFSENDHVATDLLHLVQQMRGQQYRGSLGGYGFDDFPDLVDALRIESIL